jgi:hypothetical protein
MLIMAVNISVTFPETVLEWIDRERGEIKRSTYVIKLLKQTHETKTDLKKLPKKEGIERAAATAPRVHTTSANTTTELAKGGCISNS